MKNVCMLLSGLFFLMACGPRIEIVEVQMPAASPTATPTSATPDFIGCYTDTSTRALPNWLINSDSTIESCIALAKANGYKYAGLEYAGQCFAGNVAAYTQVATSMCNMTCDADPNEICGGTWLLSIYATGL